MRLESIVYILFETCVHKKIRNMSKHVTNPQLLTQLKHAPSKKSANGFKLIHSTILKCSECKFQNI
jgi:hypothetical protein